MHPYISIFSRTVSTYGICIAIGILLCFAAMRVYTRKNQISFQEEGSFDLAFIYGLLGAAVGSKIIYLATVLPALINDLPQLTADPMAFLKIYFQGGFVFYGGFYGAVFAIYLYSKSSKTPLEMFIYAFLPGGVLAHAAGRIGCFMEGCCYGRPTASFIGVAFTDSEIAPNNIPLIPVQIIEAIFEFLLFLLLLYMSRKKAAPDLLLAFYMTAYGSFRFIIEFYRYDYYRGFIGCFSLSQVISAATIIAGSVILYKHKKLMYV